MRNSGWLVSGWLASEGHRRTVCDGRIVGMRTRAGEEGDAGETVLGLIFPF